MLVVALDTSLGAVSVAVRSCDRDGCERVEAATETRATGHAERLLPMLAEVMARGGHAFASIERIAVSVGPGTFTGVRTGIAAARALSLACGAAVVGTTSLALIMHAAAMRLAGDRRGRPIAVLSDARRGEVYFQLFGASALEPMTAAMVVPLASAAELLPAGDVIVVGSGAPMLMSAGSSPRAGIEAACGDLEPDARSLIALAADLPVLDQVEPLYVRVPDAKPQIGKSLARV